MNLSHPEWRREPVHTAWRFTTSLIRRRFVRLRQTMVLHDEGRSKMIADLRTALGLRLYRYGYRDPDLDLVRHLLCPGDVFVDGGANVGLFSLVAAACVGAEGKVIAFEPAPATRERLAANLALNAFDWVELRAQALAGGSGQVEFVAFPGDGAGLSSFAPANPQGGHVETVDTVALDEVIAESDRARITLIKLDLEGAELHALQGAADLIATENAPDLLIEVEPDHLARQGASAIALRELLIQAGYLLFRPEWDESGQVILMSTSPGATPAGGRPNLYATKNTARAQRGGIAIVGSDAGVGGVGGKESTS